MSRRLQALLLPALLCAAAVCAADTGAARIVAPEALRYMPDPRAPGAAIAVVAGDPRAAGAYTIRARFAAGATTPAHRHPDERIVTVLAGRYYFATGTRYDARALTGYGPGTVIVVPAGTPHYSAAPDGETLVQESGIGPTALELVEPLR